MVMVVMQTYKGVPYNIANWRRAFAVLSNIHKVQIAFLYKVVHIVYSVAIGLGVVYGVRRILPVTTCSDDTPSACLHVYTCRYCR